MNTANFFIFWGLMISFFYFLLWGGNENLFIVFYRIAAMIAMLLFILYFAIGAQPRMWG